MQIFLVMFRLSNPRDCLMISSSDALPNLISVYIRLNGRWGYGREISPFSFQRVANECSLFNTDLHWIYDYLFWNYRMLFIKKLMHFLKESPNFPKEVSIYSILIFSRWRTLVLSLSIWAKQHCLS